MLRPFMAIVPAIMLFALPGSSFAQCEPGWLPGEGIPGMSAPVHALTLWDPDGPGPLGQRVVIGGSMGVAGTLTARGAVSWDLQNGVLSALGSFGTVGTMAIGDQGELFAAGSYWYPTGGSGSHPAVWDGAHWQILPDSRTSGGGIATMVVLPNGSLVVGGNFNRVDTSLFPGVALWDGKNWSTLGGGIPGSVWKLVVLPGGDIIAGGSFTSAGGVAASNVARWDGGAWHPLSSGVEGGAVRSLAVLSDGTLVAAGDFVVAGGAAAHRIARWNGDTWHPYTSGTDGTVYQL